MADDDGIKFTIEGEQYALDDFELGELEWLEEHIGGTILNERNLFTIKALTGCLYIIKRRDDPEYTIEQARKVKMTALTPEPAAKKRPPKPAAR